MANKTYKLAKGWDVRVSGLDKTIELFRDLEKAAEVVGRMKARIVTAVPYAHWIEEGFYLHGRPGRRVAGPAHMMRRGLERIEDLIAPAIARSLEKGPQAVQRSVAGVLGEGTKTVKENTPVKSGNLRASFHTVGTNL
jgi:hypothetical protein